MKQYPKYKDSGIQWIGQIPEGWNVLKFKHCFNTSTGMNIAKSDLTESGVAVISYGQIHAKTNTRTHLSDDLVRYIPRELIKGGDTCKLCKNDIVFADTSEDLEGCGNAVFIDTNQEIYAGYHTIIAHPIIEGKIKYLAYLFNTPVWRQQLRKSVVGIKVYSITQKLLKDSCLLLPPFSEQESIVRYLDDKTAKIDETVNLLEQQKADLLQYRKALISKTVTRGLNPNAKLKDSGISWIGQIPEEWKVRRLKDISVFINGYAFNSNTFSKEHGKRVIRIGDIGSTIDYVNCIRTTEQNDALEFYKIHENDILIAMSGATTGKSCLAVNVEEAYINQRVGIIRSEHYGYISYILQMPYLNEYISLNDAGSAQPNVSGKSIGNLPIPLPPLTEQQAIVEYLELKTAKIDEAMKRIDEQKEDLRAYRTALITEAVTGKIDVR